MSVKKEFDLKEKFIPRDVSWLLFNKRVLEEAVDESNPLLERVKFLAIFTSNLDEFFMVRVAGLKSMIDSDINKKDHHGYYPQELMESIRSLSLDLMSEFYDVYQQKVLKQLNKSDINIVKYPDLKRDQKRFVDQYFDSTLYPIITPMAVDPGHPFPILPSKALAFAVSIARKNSAHLAIIPIPRNVRRLIKLPSVKNEHNFILVDDVIRAHLETLFKGFTINHYCMFRVMRDSEIGGEEEFTPDLLKMIEEEVKKRARAKAVYLEVEKHCPSELLDQLCEGLKFFQEEVNHINGDLDLAFLFELYNQVDRPDLKYPGFVPHKLSYENIFDKIKEGDFLLHIPFQSFQPTIDLLETAAKDNHVLAIKMTLYRTSRDSAIIRALQEAAENGKQVTVLVEIKARFDEENNIRWVKELEDAGCHVIYGIPGLKVHSKMLLVVRQEEGHIQRYVHLSTGNYNEHTARVYTDLGYFTANEDFAREISDVFNVVTGYSMPSPWKRIVSSPYDLRDYFFDLIDREIKFQKTHKNGRIMVKVNSLEDPQMIEKLYEASQAGVRIELLVRGICCLIPGVKGLSENIEVRSIVGRFLEHSRVYQFNNNDKPRVFLSSADWMTRNLDRRVELLFEIYIQDIKKYLTQTLDGYWKDDVKARELTASREYRYLEHKKQCDAQHELIRHHGTS